MKLFLALATLIVSSVRGDPVLAEDWRTHAWCCTDGDCADSCKIFNYMAIPGSDPEVLWIDAYNGGDYLTEGDDPLTTSVSPCRLDPEFEFPAGSGNTYNKCEIFNNNGGDTPGLAAAWCDYFYTGLTIIGNKPEDTYRCAPSSDGVTDPHFRLWSGSWFDFHGECDLEFVNAPSFAQGLGMETQIRTKQEGQYSYIEAAAMKIGDDILEVGSYGQYFLNGVEGADLNGAHLGPFEIKYEFINKNQQTFDIITGDSQMIQISTIKKMVNVKLHDVNRQDFDAAFGMLGAFPTGQLAARDGTIMKGDNKHNEFGMEWQVRGESFFQSKSEVQYPQQCKMPTLSAEAGRRLGEVSVSQEAAEKACESLTGDVFDNCVFDAMATGDLELAAAGAY